MPLETIPLLGPSQESRSFKVNPQRSVNLFASPERPGAKSPIVLYPTPGLDLIAEPTVGIGRSNFVPWLGNLYGVVDASLVKIAPGDVVTSYTGLSTTTGRVSMARGRTQLALADGSFLYSFDGATLAKVTDGQAPINPSHVAYLDGFFIANNDDSDEFQISAVDDVTAWDAADSASAIGSSDNVDALATTNKDLYLIGASTTEVWTNTGNPDFPFEVYPGGILEVGIIAPHSLVRSVLGLISLAANDEGDAVLIRSVGFQPEVISDPDLTYQINKLTSLTDAFGSIYRRHGRTFYVLTFPTDDKTFEIDIDTKLWHQRKSNGIGRWRGAGIGFLNSNFYVSDYNSGKILKLSDSLYTEDEDTIERERFTQVVHFNNRRFQTHRLMIDVETGVGLVSGQGSDPQLMLRYSDDGGNTYSNELSKSIGKIGEYSTRVVFDNLGESRNRIYWLRLTDPVKFVMTGAYAEVEVLAD
jgi:hypothetical protein